MSIVLKVSKWLLIIVAALLAILFIVNAVLAGRIKSNHPPAGRFIELSAGKLHVIEKGTGERTIVLVHGAGANAMGWYSVHNTLAEHARVIAIDRPGHGFSDRISDTARDPAEQARIIHEALEAEGIEDPIMVGHSWGGALVLAYGIAYPDDISGIVALAAASHPDPVIDAEPVSGGTIWFQERFVLPLLLTLNPNFMADLAFAPENTIKDYGVKSAIPVIALKDRVGAIYDDSTGIKPGMEAISRRYSSARAPLLVITGSADAAVKPDLHARRLAQEWPGAQLLELEGSGHMINHTRADDIVRAIEGFEILSDE